MDMHAKGGSHGLVDKDRIVSSKCTLEKFVSKLGQFCLLHFAHIIQMIHYKPLVPAVYAMGRISPKRDICSNYHENYEPCIPASVLPHPPTGNSCECCQCGPTPSHVCQTLSQCERQSY